MSEPTLDFAVCIMTDFEFPCEFEGCDWKSVPCDPPTGAKFLEAHIKAKHSEVEPKHNPTGGVAKAKVERAKRPEIRSEETEEDWAYMVGPVQNPM